MFVEIHLSRSTNTILEVNRFVSQLWLINNGFDKS